MSQQFRIVNSDARAYALNFFKDVSRQLMSFSYFNNDNALLLMVLLGNSEIKEEAGARDLIGIEDWSGDRIIVAGDYGDNRKYLTQADIDSVDAINQRDPDWYSRYGTDSNGKPNVNLEKAAHRLKWPNVLDRPSINNRLVEDEDEDLVLPESDYEALLEVKKRAYAVNLTDDTYIDLGRYAKEHAHQELMIDPLFLLLANGNGQGNGDYRGWNEDMVGAWAGSQITITMQPPRGFSELHLLFEENGAHPAMFRVSRPDDMDFRA